MYYSLNNQKINLLVVIFLFDGINVNPSIPLSACEFPSMWTEAAEYQTNSAEHTSVRCEGLFVTDAVQGHWKDVRAHIDCRGPYRRSDYILGLSSKYFMLNQDSNREYDSLLRNTHIQQFFSHF